MDRHQIREHLLRALIDTAPETDVGAIDSARPLRQQVDLDSADWLNFLIAVHAALGIDVPDADAPRLTTLDKWVDYCAQRLPAAAQPSAASPEAP